MPLCRVPWFLFSINYFRTYAKILCVNTARYVVLENATVCHVARTLSCVLTHSSCINKCTVHETCPARARPSAPEPKPWDRTSGRVSRVADAVCSTSWLNLKARALILGLQRGYPRALPLGARARAETTHSCRCPLLQLATAGTGTAVPPRS